MPSHFMPERVPSVEFGLGFFLFTFKVQWFFLSRTYSGPPKVKLSSRGVQSEWVEGETETAMRHCGETR